jgi:hypothetical protein
MPWSPCNPCAPCNPCGPVAPVGPARTSLIIVVVPLPDPVLAEEEVVVAFLLVTVVGVTTITFVES